jgi:tRNA threonylcarbamoyladenosine biosynthesis protein TsaE
VSDASSFAVALPDERATQTLAARLAARARQGDVIALKGPLGSGKTSFARGFIAARCGAPQEVPSPTFTLVQVYPADGPAIWHFDLFRLAAPDEAWELGIEDAFADGISLIEWPERLGALLPPGRLEVALAFAARPESRLATIAPSSAWSERVAGLRHG